MTKEEAIAKIRKMSLPQETMEILSALAPELRESEDERIRKWILEYLYDGLRKSDEQFKDQFKSAIAWLEKQKAKERLDRMAPIYNNKESFESALEKAWKYYNESASRTVDSFEDDYIECVFSKGFREGFLYREKQKEQKPADVAPNQFDGITYGMQGCSTEKPAEWSEEDEENLNSIISCLNRSLDGVIDTVEITNVVGEIAWLKSLRPPQYCENCKLKRSVEGWKPSDEQIEALEWMLTTVTIKDGGKGVVLKNLVNDLKKQM